MSNGPATSVNKTPDLRIQAKATWATVLHAGVRHCHSLAIRLAPSGASTVVSAKLWPTGAAEPTAWQVSATDGTAAVQGPGSVQLSSYLSSSATAPVTTSLDDLDG